MRTALMIAVTLAVSACASDPSSPDRTGQYAALAEACSDRGGVLTQPMARPLTGNAGTGFVCQVGGSGSRIPPATTAD